MKMEQGKEMNANSNEQNNNTNNKLEQRMWSILITISLAFGGIWLQNQYATVQSLLEQLHEYQRFVDDKYVAQKQYESNERTNENRLNRLEININTLMEILAKIQQDNVKRQAEDEARDLTTNDRIMNGQGNHPVLK